jgi:peptide-methionine (S)-S-oxide reductase
MQLHPLLVRFLSVLLLSMIFGACAGASQSNRALYNNKTESFSKDTAVFAGGCFWCTEAQFEQIRGVDTVISGFIGGRVSHPSYGLVSSGLSGHAEAILVVFDPTKITYYQLLEVFFGSHDPTQLNRQGNDVGTQYRSAIFYRTDEQKNQAEETIQSLGAAKIFSKPIVTTLEPYKVFYIADEEHQDYFNKNADDAYCRYVITPKLSKFKQVFESLLKDSVSLK